LGVARGSTDIPRATRNVSATGPHGAFALARSLRGARDSRDRDRALAAVVAQGPWKRI